jgi:hypothetical protein
MPKICPTACTQEEAVRWRLVINLLGKFLFLINNNKSQTLKLFLFPYFFGFLNQECSNKATHPKDLTKLSIQE